MVMYNLTTTKIDFFFFQIQLICHVAIFNYAMCHNFEPSLIIIMDDGDQYFNVFLMSNFFS
jgi:hypothetical protein